MIFRRSFVLAAAIVIAPGSGCAQPPNAPFEPFPGGIATRYRFDLARNFFPSPDAEQKHRDSLSLALRAFASAASTELRQPPSAPSLVGLLARADSLQEQLGRHYAYLSLRGVLDSRDESSNAATSALAAVEQSSFSALNRALASLTPAQLDRLIAEEPRLAQYRYGIVSARVRPLAVPDSMRSVIPALQNRALAWGPQRFRQILGTIHFGKVKAPEGELDVRTQGSQIYNHAERSVREAGFRANNAGIESRKDSFALVITETARARNTLARFRGYRDHRDESYGERLLTSADVQRVLGGIAAQSSVNRRYEQVRIDRLRKMLGYDTVHFWDLTAPPRGTVAPQFTITDGARVIVESTKRLGTRYEAEMRALLDPANGRIDLMPAANRVDRPGFSTGSVGYPSMLFQGRYEGFVSDLVILVHEAGHGVQNMLMDSNGVLPRYAGGPGYFTESYAALNELLLLQHLSRTSRDAATRIYYLERLVDQAVDLYRNAAESLVEDRIYDSVAAGRMLDADAIETLYQNTAAGFSSWYGPTSEVKLAWARPLQFFTRPLYRINYVYAKLLALNYIERLESDPKFAARYVSLLSRGYDAPPDVLLREETGIELRDSDAVVRAATRRIARWVDELEGLYQSDK